MNTHTIREFLTSVFTSLDGEEIYACRADSPGLSIAVSSLEDAERYIEDNRDSGVFISTGTFAPGTARKQEHLLCAPVIVLDGDLKSALGHEGIADAEAKVRQCSATTLAKWRAAHVGVITDTLARAGIDALSALIFSGGGHHVYLFIDFLDQREVGRIRKVHFELVHRLNKIAGFELFDEQVVDTGTRLIRCPGTANLKCNPVRYSEVVQNSGPTFTLQQLESIAGVQPEAEKAEACADDFTEEAQTENQDNHTAIVALIAPHWTRGDRHALALGLSGYLAKLEWPWKKAQALFLEIARTTSDEELKSRLVDLKGTYHRLSQGKPVAGYTSLETLLPADVLKALQAIVGDREIPIDETPAKLLLVTRPYSDIQERETDWLWFPYLPAGNLVSVEGNPGEGKSWVTLSLAAAASLGEFPFRFNNGGPAGSVNELREPANVLHLNVEDDPEQTIKKRLRILGADCSRVHCIEGVRREEDGEGFLDFNLTHIAALEESINHHRARLVILDPVQAYLPRGADMNKAESIRPLLNGLAQMARRTSTTVMLVRHFGKRVADTAIHKAIGSIDFAAAVRSVLIVGRYPKEKDSLTLFERGVVIHAKYNLAPRGLSLDFALQLDSFKWLGTSNTEAEEFTQPRDKGDADECGKYAEATEFLKEFLAHGPADRKVILEEGKKLGLSDRTLDLVATRLRIHKTRHYANGKVSSSTWELPNAA